MKVKPLIQKLYKSCIEHDKEKREKGLVQDSQKITEAQTHRSG